MAPFSPSILCRRHPWRAAWGALVCLALPCSPAAAHFQVLIPGSDVLASVDAGSVDLSILFTHPMEQGPVMEMAPPRRFGVLVGGKQLDLLPALRATKTEGKTTYTATARLERPGDYVFYLEPAPYWEPAEEKMIVHYTKVVVDFLGAQQGWDAMVGLPVEIQPLARPYGLWAGNCFRGIVKKHGKPVPFATVEVEYYNQGRKLGLPNDTFATQVVKADAAGVFCYTMPRAGWWGFAALVEGDQPMKAPNGKQVEVEWGGVIWVRTVDMK